jgi:acyl-CoA thioester hydrolase
MNPIYKHDVKVTADMVDGNGHVNNVVYIQWMQDSAIHHAKVSGCTQVSESLGATWVVRTHHVEYLRPAFAGDAITVLTWVADFRRVRSLRKYKLIRARDKAIVAQAETDWAFVDAKTGKPRAIPDEVKKTLPVVATSATSTPALGDAL